MSRALDRQAVNRGRVGKKHRVRQKQDSCGKARFRDGAEAKSALTRIRGNSNRGIKPQRAYECEDCLGWHLTSWD